LLQWINTERVLDLELRQLAVVAVGADVELACAGKELARGAGVGKARVVKIAEDTCFVCNAHGNAVLRLVPLLCLHGVTGQAGAAADELGHARAGPWLACRQAI